MYPYTGLTYPSMPMVPGSMTFPYGNWSPPAPVYQQAYPAPMPDYWPPQPVNSSVPPMPSPMPSVQVEAPQPTTNPGTASPSFSEVKASHILVKTRQEAEQIRKEIISGKKRFEDAAKVSKCPSGKKGGDLGFFSRGDMVPAFDKVAFKLPVGVISDPVKTDFGWHLIRVTAQR